MIYIPALSSTPAQHDEINKTLIHLLIECHLCIRGYVFYWCISVI